MKIKLIASDLDGTLLTDQKTLSPETVKTLRWAADKGIYLVPVTGRSYTAVPDFIKEFPGVEYVITSNGGAVYSAASGERIYQRLLEPESVEAAFKAPRPDNMAVEIFIEGRPYSEMSYVNDPKAYGATEYGAEYVRRTRTPVEDLESFAMENRDRLDSMAFVCADPAEREEFRLYLRNHVPDIYVTSSVSHLLEIGHKDAGKGNTLRYLMDYLGVDREETMAVGDGDNDISMLRAVRHGVAVKERNESLQGCGCPGDRKQSGGRCGAGGKVLCRIRDMIRNIDDFNIERKYGSAGWGGAPVLRYHSSLRAADLLFFG